MRNRAVAQASAGERNGEPCAASRHSRQPVSPYPASGRARCTPPNPQPRMKPGTLRRTIGNLNPSRWQWPSPGQQTNSSNCTYPKRARRLRRVSVVTHSLWSPAHSWNLTAPGTCLQRSHLAPAGPSVSAVLDFALDIAHAEQDHEFVAELLEFARIQTLPAATAEASADLALSTPPIVLVNGRTRLARPGEQHRPARVSLEHAAKKAAARHLVALLEHG